MPQCRKPPQSDRQLFAAPRRTDSLRFGDEYEPHSAFTRLLPQMPLPRTVVRHRAPAVSHCPHVSHVTSTPSFSSSRSMVRSTSADIPSTSIPFRSIVISRGSRSIAVSRSPPLAQRHQPPDALHDRERRRIGEQTVESGRKTCAGKDENPDPSLLFQRIGNEHCENGSEPEESKRIHVLMPIPERPLHDYAFTA